MPVQKQSTWLPLILPTVIKGPPERNRTRSPRRNEAAVWLCITVFDGTESEKAGTDKGILNAIPSTNAVVIDARFVNANMLNSISRAADIGSHFTDTTKLRFRGGRGGRDDLGSTTCSYLRVPAPRAVGVELPYHGVTLVSPKG